MLNKKVIKIALAVILIIVAARVYFRVTDDFRLGNITYSMPFHPEWEIPPLDLREKGKIDQLLKQKFSYIGKGAQAYAFGSEDGKAVIKFFKFKHLRPNAWSDLLPSISPFREYKENLAIRKNRKLYGVFEGYRLAYETHKEGSGILFIQLNIPASNKPLMITLIDKIGLTRHVDLNKVPFILQEKAKTTRALVNEALAAKDVDKASSLIDKIFDLYVEEYQKGIYDKDHGVMHNTGFVEDRPIHLDIGKLTREQELAKTEFWQRDLEVIAWKFATWTRETYPQFARKLEKKMERKLSSLFGRSFTFSESPPPPRKRRH